VIDSALDELEFIMGDASTPWGAIRESLGESAWSINWVEIGNEDWLAGAPSGFESYQAYRFPLLMQAILEKYPNMRIVNSGSFYETPAIPSPAIGDYHPYRQPDDYYHEFHKLDNLTADNLTIVGEFASVHVNGGIDWEGDLYKFPWWLGGVGEAIFMIGNERNGDRVLGSTYAPALRNMNRWQWSVCLIEFEADTSKTTLSTSWHVFRLFSTHAITHTFSTTPESNTSSLFWVAGQREGFEGQADSGLVVKMANYNTTGHVDTPVSLAFEGVQVGDEASLTVLTSREGPWGYNDPYTGSNVVVERTEMVKAGGNGTFSWVMPEWSVAVLDMRG
jgi:alpha-N-arabinofuranosidase